jgi:hypothetical protein
MVDKGLVEDADIVGRNSWYEAVAALRSRLVTSGVGTGLGYLD